MSLLAAGFLDVVHSRRRAPAPDCQTEPPRGAAIAAVKGIRILGTNRSIIRPADDVAVWAPASPAVTEN